MLTHPTHDRLLALGLTGIAKALEEQRRSTAFDNLTFEERLGILVDREAAERDGKKLASRLKFAALRQDLQRVDPGTGSLQCSRAEISGVDPGARRQAALHQQDGQRIELFSSGATCIPDLDVRPGTQHRQHPVSHSGVEVRIAEESGDVDREVADNPVER